MITGGKRMKSLLLSGKVKPDIGGQVLDLYNQMVLQGISPTIKTTIDKSNMTFVTVMNKQIIHTAPNGKKYSIQIRKYTPRDCFRLMGVHEADIDKLLSKEKSGASIICKSKLYALAGNSIRTTEIINRGFPKPYQALNELVREGRINWCKTLNDMAFTIRS